MTKIWHAAAVAACVWLAGCGAGTPAPSADATQQTMDPYERTGNVVGKTGATTKPPAVLAAPAPAQAPPPVAKAQ